jgi:hypothetical protein
MVHIMGEIVMYFSARKQPASHMAEEREMKGKNITSQKEMEAYFDILI